MLKNEFTVAQLTAAATLAQQLASVREREIVSQIRRRYRRGRARDGAPDIDGTPAPARPTLGISSCFPEKNDLRESTPPAPSRRPRGVTRPTTARSSKWLRLISASKRIAPRSARDGGARAPPAGIELQSNRIRCGPGRAGRGRLQLASAASAARPRVRA
ncbi:hypothetical protein EVAR_104013_1 [Eumeta japonica]|uniref:Uncharacterized protein n=1 Tax=Eumeta variegata TaxID=151549 RepID=A0A4C1XY30_EUMVA|nr:hypothetical protein EVAR_104013_1 [Eumeta japonica]